MNIALENILKVSSDLKDHSRNFIIKQLKIISNKVNGLIAQNESYKRQITGVDSVRYNETLQKAVDTLKLLGFNDIEFVGLNPDFLNWIIEETTSIKKYNPKLMNFYLLTSMQQAYYLTSAEKDGIKPTYNEVRNTMLTFNERINDLEYTLKLSLPDLINKIDGKN